MSFIFRLKTFNNSAEQQSKTEQMQCKYHAGSWTNKVIFSL